MQIHSFQGSLAGDSFAVRANMLRFRLSTSLRRSLFKTWPVIFRCWYVWVYFIVLHTQTLAEESRPAAPPENQAAGKPSASDIHLDNAHSEPLPSGNLPANQPVIAPQKVAETFRKELSAPKIARHFSGATVVQEFRFDDQEDLDQDDLPDGWLRRKGAPFPRYVESMIDRSPPGLDHHALRFRVNGGPAVFYSPLVRVDPNYNLAVTGSIQTSGLNHSAGLISISVLDARRERLARWLSQPVSGSQAWEAAVIGPVSLPPQAAFVVVGCHVVDGLQTDVRGDVWFADLQVVRLPNIDWGSSPLNCFQDKDLNFNLDMAFTGLEPTLEYQLDLTARDVDGNLIARDQRTLKPEQSKPVDQSANAQPTTVAEPRRVTWNLDQLEYGHYQMEARLTHAGVLVLQKTRPFVRFETLEKPLTTGEFGWSVPSVMPQRVLNTLSAMVDQTATSWVKYPVWESADDPALMSETTEFFEDLAEKGVTIVGVFGAPPKPLQAMTSQEWQGSAEIFSLPREIWADSMHPALARYGSHIRRWQLGSDRDHSFVDGLNTVLGFRVARSEIQSISRGSMVGTAWTPQSKELPRGIDFVISPASLELPKRNSAETAEQWVVLQASDLKGTTPPQIAGELAKRMIEQRKAGIETILHGDPFHPQSGVFSPDGSPGNMFLPWRTLAISLSGKEFAGAFTLPQRSENAVFIDEHEACVVLWNQRETIEKAHLGNEAVLVDLWGRQRKLLIDQVTGQQLLPVGPVPIIVRKCSPALAKWRVATHFERGRCRSEYGMHEDALVGTNTFPQGASATVELLLPKEWNAEPRSSNLQLRAREPWRIPFRFLLPATASLGDHEAEIVFKIDADQHYEFRMPLVYRVGLDDITIEVIDRLLPDGRLEIEQRVTNRTVPEEIVDFRCSLFIPNERRQRVNIPRLGEGLDKKIFYLPDGARFDGQTLWLRLEQENGRRILNYRWVVKTGQDSPATGNEFSSR
ncbi:hypothetical protein Plim_1205 [Planctopirus limnophila DSM 3776]|uniref:Uncharacterized protein n=1 Tax=Planctopirus limnophila (strain ATCC 43296 / DSM 3776 / IFAM 1008 / Mu 290) TaxID=521674 RepID=D5SUI8_PLAL2|nr:hypothetical protein [Planctopirus limnophila]ADG67040.1 hypothetical protein Plim_1205 [Planctopirus limnophila DSM 3776]